MKHIKPQPSSLEHYHCNHDRIGKTACCDTLICDDCGTVWREDGKISDQIEINPENLLNQLLKDL